MDEIATMPSRDYPKFPIFDVPVTALTLEELLGEIQYALSNNRRITIGNVNIHALNLIWRNPDVARFFQESDIIFCDGFGVKIGASILGFDLPERFTPPDFVHDIMKIASENGRSVFLLGAKPGVAELAALHLKQVTPQLQIAGTHHGYFEKTPKSLENARVVELINSTKANVLLIGFGMPLQEEWLSNNWDRLNVNVALLTGAMFDTLSGMIPRAPKFITDHGFEWLARLIVEPKRLWKRYLIGNPLFFLRIIFEKMRCLF